MSTRGTFPAGVGWRLGAAPGPGQPGLTGPHRSDFGGTRGRFLVQSRSNPKVGSCRKGEVVELVTGSSELGCSGMKCLSSSQGIGLKYLCPKEVANAVTASLIVIFQISLFKDSTVGPGYL